MEELEEYYKCLADKGEMDIDRLEEAVRKHLASPVPDVRHRISSGTNVYVAKASDAPVLTLTNHRLKNDLSFVDFMMEAAPSDPKQPFRVRGDLPYQNRPLMFTTIISETIQTVKSFDKINLIVVGTGNPKYPFIVCEGRFVVDDD